MGITKKKVIYPGMISLVVVYRQACMHVGPGAMIHMAAAHLNTVTHLSSVTLTKIANQQPMLLKIIISVLGYQT